MQWNYPALHSRAFYLPRCGYCKIGVSNSFTEQNIKLMQRARIKEVINWQLMQKVRCGRLPGACQKTLLIEQSRAPRRSLATSQLMMRDWQKQQISHARFIEKNSALALKKHKNLLTYANINVTTTIDWLARMGIFSGYGNSPDQM